MKHTKKIIYILVFALIISLSMGCRSNKKPCPAYDVLKIENFVK